MFENIFALGRIFFHWACAAILEKHISILETQSDLVNERAIGNGNNITRKETRPNMLKRLSSWSTRKKEKINVIISNLIRHHRVFLEVNLSCGFEKLRAKV